MPIIKNSGAIPGKIKLINPLIVIVVKIAPKAIKTIPINMKADTFFMSLLDLVDK